MVKDTLQDKINKLKQMAEASKENFSSREKKSSIEVSDSLAKAITNKKDAVIFMAELDAAIKIAQEK
jgi:hypothetical protein